MGLFTFQRGFSWYFITCAGASCGVVPRRQADGFFEEAELGVVKPKRLIDDVRRRLHVHPQDGHQVAVISFEGNLWKEEKEKHKHWNLEKTNTGGSLYSDQMAPQSVFNWPQKQDKKVTGADGVSSRLLLSNSYWTILSSFASLTDFVLRNWIEMA